MLRSVLFVRSVVSRYSTSIPAGTPFSCCAFADRRSWPFYFKRNTPNHLRGRWLDHSAPTVNICTSPSVKGLEEFFPRTDDILEEGEKSGREWVASDLRQKSNDDLHKLWYVLLKERNMLLTLKIEANKFRYIIPAPERLRKVQKSMARVKLVIHERRLAIVEAKEKLGVISAIDAIEEKMTNAKRKKHRKSRLRREYLSKNKEIRSP